MKLGIGTYTYTWAIGVPGHPPSAPMAALDLLEKTKELGLEVVQIADNLPLKMGEDLERLIEKVKAEDLTVELGTRGVEPRHLLPYLEIASKMGCALLRSLLDAKDSHPTIAQSIEWVRKILPELEKKEVVLAIENHDRFRCDELLELIHTVNHPLVGICLDTVNSFGALEGPDIVIEKLAPVTVNLHLKDFRITRVGSQMGFSVEGAPAGQGCLEIPQLLEQVKSHGKTRSAILELWTPLDKSLESTIQKEKDWALQSIDYLKPYIN